MRKRKLNRLQMLDEYKVKAIENKVFKEYGSDAKLPISSPKDSLKKLKKALRKGDMATVKMYRHTKRSDAHYFKLGLSKAGEVKTYKLEELK